MGEAVEEELRAKALRQEESEGPARAPSAGGCRADPEAG